MSTLTRSRLTIFALAAACAFGASSCGGGGKRKKSDAARWLDKPASAKTNGSVFVFEQLGVRFEIPDTLYVYRACGEASHTPEGENKWVPVITCRSVALDNEDEYAEGGGAESIDLTFYVTEKSRPIDERSIAWFENQYKQAGLSIENISYNDNYQRKAGIFAKLRVLDPGSGAPSREIIQFMFPKNDVVFIAKMDYPFGDTRAVQADWQYLLWNFDASFTGTGDDLPPAKPKSEPVEEKKEEEEEIP